MPHDDIITVMRIIQNAESHAKLTNTQQQCRLCQQYQKNYYVQMEKAQLSRVNKCKPKTR